MARGSPHLIVKRARGPSSAAAATSCWSIDDLLPRRSDVIDQLRDVAATWRRLRQQEEDGSFFSSYARVPDDASTYARVQVRDVLLPALGPLVDPAAARLRPSVFQMKPPSPTSDLQAHQDCFLVDERRSFGVFAWVALTDVGLDAGPLYVVPGSHRHGTWKRISSTTDQFARLHEVIHRHARALEVSAGQVILFHNHPRPSASPPGRPRPCGATGRGGSVGRVAAVVQT